MPGDPGAGTSSYWVMPSNTSLFLQRCILWCSAVSSGYISFITFWLFVCITSFYLSLTVILTSHFSNITYFRQQQQQNKPMKYYEILPTHTETPRNTTRKIANLYIEFNYHFLTLQKKSHYFWTGVYKTSTLCWICLCWVMLDPSILLNWLWCILIRLPHCRWSNLEVYG